MNNNSLTIGFCHRCGKSIPLVKDVISGNVGFLRCPFCGYQNEMENIEEFLKKKQVKKEEK